MGKGFAAMCYFQVVIVIGTNAGPFGHCVYLCDAGVQKMLQVNVHCVWNALCCITGSPSSTCTTMYCMYWRHKEGRDKICGSNLNASCAECDAWCTACVNFIFHSDLFSVMKIYASPWNGHFQSLQLSGHGKTINTGLIPATIKQEFSSCVIPWIIT